MSDAPRVYCPSCETDADQIAEMLEVSFCGAHMPARNGADDALASSFGFDAVSEAEGNRAMCALIHGAPRYTPKGT